MTPYWIWLGPVHDEATMLQRAAVSTAANRWQKGLLGALSAIGTDVEVVSYLPEPAWPRGEALPPRTAVSMAGESVGYLNVAGAIRDLSLAWSHRRAVERIVNRKGARPQALLTYNVQPAYARVALAAQARGTPWVAVIADLPPNAAGLARHDRWAAAAAGRVFLAWAAFEADRTRARLHLDGGVAGVDGCRAVAPSGRSILYSGTLSQYGGLDLLLSAFAKVEGSDVELWVCGKGTSAQLERAAREDPRIKVLGLVPDARLAELSTQASVFANPRPAGIVASQYNFPSKVLEYLSHGKPVVSTWTPGLAPEYRDVIMTAPEDPVGFARQLEAALALGAAERSELSRRIRSFLETRRLWSVQATRLRDWIRTEVARS